MTTKLKVYNCLTHHSLGKTKNICSPMQAPGSILTPKIYNFLLTCFKVPKILNRTGAKQETIEMLMGGLQCILRGEIPENCPPSTSQSPWKNTYEILLLSLGNYRADILLTALLRDIFYNDIFSGIQVAHFFGDEICLMVDLVTRSNQNGELYAQRFTSVLERFNSADTDKETQLMTAVILVLMAERIQLLGDCFISTPPSTISTIIETTKSHFIHCFIDKLILTNIHEEEKISLQVLKSFIFILVEALDSNDNMKIM